MHILEFSRTLSQKLQSLSHVTLIAHKNPDGDAFGSLEGMRQLLLTNHPHLSVDVVIPEEDFDTHVSWIMGETVHSISQKTNLIILLDTSLVTRTALPIEAFETHEVMCIDHHESFPDSLSGFRDATASATCLLLTEMAMALEWGISAEAATALLMGIYTDTGGFIHRSTDVRSFTAAAELMRLGADQPRISTEVFGNYSLEYLHDLGSWLLSIVVEDGIATLFLKDATNAALKNHIIGFLSGLQNVDIACVLVDIGGVIKCSFRTRKADMDVNELAKKLGGGGHKKASGCIFEGKIENDIFHWQDKTYTPKSFAQFIKTL
jgi:bifunctional oligoribonuclease and PAP phosphatase NrnA